MKKIGSQETGKKKIQNAEPARKNQSPAEPKAKSQSESGQVGLYDNRVVTGNTGKDGCELRKPSIFKNSALHRYFVNGHQTSKQGERDVSVTRIKTVHCPVCDKVIPMKVINKHLDEECSGLVKSLAAESSSNVHSRLSTKNLPRQSPDFQKLKSIEQEPQAGPSHKSMNSAKRECISPELDDITLHGGVNMIKSGINYFRLQRKLTETFCVDEELLKCRLTLNPFSNDHDDIICLDDVNEDAGLKHQDSSVSETPANIIYNDNSSNEALNTEHVPDIERTCNLPKGHSMTKSNNSDSVMVRPIGSDSMVTADASVISQDNNEINMDELVNEKLPYEPYYLANFKFVLDNVLDEEDNKNLFDVEDLSIINQFGLLSCEAQKMYIRLYLRKYTWFRCAKLSYPKISADLSPHITELVNSGKTLPYTLYLLSG